MSTFGKIGGHMKIGWIEQKFCICGPDRNFGAARLCAARRILTIIIPQATANVNRQFIQKSHLIFGENVFVKNAQKNPAQSSGIS